MEYNTALNCFIIFFLAANASCGTLQLRTKRIDRILEEEIDKKSHVRTKRIGKFNSDDNNKSKKKNMDIDSNLKINVYEKKISEKLLEMYKKIASLSGRNATVSTTEQPLVDAVTEKSETSTGKLDISTEKSETSTDSLTTSTTKNIDEEQGNFDSQNNEIEPNNNIYDLNESLFGTCRGRKMNRKYSMKNCNEVSIKTLECGGICQPATAHLFEDYFNNNIYDMCTFCGPQEYEEKMIFLQCYSGNVKRRRWKIEVLKISIPKTCGCIKESCQKLNMVSHEQNKFYK